MVPTRLVVVVFPCDPATAIAFLFLINSANISALLTRGIDNSLHFCISGFDCPIAEENTAADILFIFDFL